MRIVRAKPEQAEEISKLRVKTIKSFPQDNSEKEMEYVLKRNTPEMIMEKIKKRDMFNMVEKGKIIGNVELNNDKLSNLYVDRDRLKKGIGKSLLLFIEGYARKKGITRLHLRSTPSAITFYKKFGYKIVKVEKKIEQGIEMVHTMMEKDLK